MKINWDVENRIGHKYNLNWDKEQQDKVYDYVCYYQNNKNIVVNATIVNCVNSSWVYISVWDDDSLIEYTHWFIAGNKVVSDIKQLSLFDNDYECPSGIGVENE